MSTASRNFWCIRVLALVAPFTLTACLENTGIVAKADHSLSSTQSNCVLPDALAVRAVAQKLTANSIRLPNDFCSKPGGYDCVVHKFGPSLSNSESVAAETANVAELGGDVSISLNIQTFNTFATAHLPGALAAASQPGGELNHTEYVCHQHDLWDAGSSLGLGEGDNLKDALASAYAHCSDIAPRVASGK